MGNKPAFQARRLMTLVFLAPIIAIASLTALLQMLTAYSDYDDEGYMLLTVKHFLDGHALYSEVPTIYGPFYYLKAWVLHGLLSIPVSHDASRLLSVGVWLVISLLVSVCSWLATQRAWLALGSYIAVLFYLFTLKFEPGHPQEIAALLVVCSVLVGLAADRGYAQLLPIGTGIAAAALVLTKINAGVYATSSLTLASLVGGSTGRIRRWLRAVFAVAIMLLPLAVAHAHLHTTWGLSYALLVSLSVGALLIVGMGSGWIPSASEYSLFLLSFLCMVGATLTFIGMQGSTLSATVESLILMPQRLTRYFAAPAPVEPWGVALALFAIATALLFSRTLSRESGRARGLFAVVKLGFGLFVLFRAVSLDSRALLVFGTPFIWLGLTPYPDTRQPPASRLVLCFVAVLQTFQAYPVPGSQVYTGTFLIILVGAICIHDALSWLGELQWIRLLPRRLSLAGVASIYLFTGALCIHRLQTAWVGYRASAPLNLPGAEWVRVDARHASLIHWLVERVDHSGDTFISTTGMNSLYFWTRKEPPSLIVIGNSLDLYTPRQQQIMAQSLMAHPKAVVIRHPALFGIEPSRDNLLVQTIDANFRKLEVREEYELWVRTDRALPPPQPRPLQGDETLGNPPAPAGMAIGQVVPSRSSLATPLREHQ